MDITMKSSSGLVENYEVKGKQFWGKLFVVCQNIKILPFMK